jgi:peptide/nickel transport system permease protein
LIRRLRATKGRKLGFEQGGGGRLWPALLILALAHGTVLLAGVLSPYDPTRQHRDYPYAPPTKIHFVDAAHNVHLRPFVYALVAREDGNGYEESRNHIYPLRLLIAQSSTSPSGELRTTRRLFGVGAPAMLYLLGSDGYGRDQFSRLLYGGRISLLAGLLAAVLSLGMGTILGAISGLYQGWTDTVVMRGAELFMALPWLYLLFTVRAFLPLAIRPEQAFLLLIAVVGIVGWARPARMIRAAVLSAKERPYVTAARGFGASEFYLLRRHILPQTLNVILTQAAILRRSRAILRSLLSPPLFPSTKRRFPVLLYYPETIFSRYCPHPL